MAHMFVPKGVVGATPPTKKVEQPVMIEIRKHGDCGDFRLSLQVLDQNGRGVKSVIVFYDDSCLKPILPGGLNKSSQTTDDSGYIANFKLKPFKEIERDISIEVVGTGLNRKIHLSGPPKPIPHVRLRSGEGFWGNFLQKPTLRRRK